MRGGRVALVLSLGVMACGEALLLAEQHDAAVPVDEGGVTPSSTGASDARAVDASTSRDAASAPGPSCTVTPYNACGDASNCRPLADVSTSECPATWAETIADKFDFCARYKNDPLYGVARSTEVCRGWLRYTAYLFDAGPRYCLYDPVTERLAGYGAFDGKASHEEWTCGFARGDFSDQDCPALTCDDVETPDGGVCPPGVKQCTSGVSQTCDATGHWDTGTTCPFACVKGSCNGECFPGAKECVGSLPRSCDDTGHWRSFATCTHACGGGSCGAACDGTCACVDGICPSTEIAPDAFDLAIDATNIYWSTSATPGALMKAPLAGGPAVQLASTGYLTQQIVPTATDLYWAEPPPGPWGSTVPGALKRVPINGGAVTTLFTSIEGPYGVAVDATGVFFSRGVIPTTSNTLMKIPLAGGPAVTLATTTATRLVRDANNLYWTDLSAAVGGDVLAMPLTGGPSVRIASGQRWAIGFAVDATRIYWVDDGALVAAPLSGGPRTILASGQGQPLSMAVDGANVYWTNNGPHPYGGVMTMPISGGSPTVVAEDESPGRLVISASHVYWTSNGKLRRIAK